MKMASKKTPENTLGQLLICLRMSELHYVVKETPYSAFVTIRKKFVKSSNKDVHENENVVKDINDNSKELERENCQQKQKVKELEKECAMLQFEKEELEIKLEAVEKQNITLEDQIEVEMARNREVVKDNEKLYNENNDIKNESAKTKNKSIETTKKLEVLGKSMKELDDKVFLLEHIVKNRELEIDSLRKELESFQATTSIECKNCDVKETVCLDSHQKESESFQDTTSMRNYVTCDHCEFVDENEASMRLHMKETHEVVKCETCNETFGGSNKLKNHMCRIPIEDPEYFDMYMRNWYRIGDCIPVFSKRLKKELIILHSENCWESKNSCSDIPENVDTSVKATVDENNIIHTAAIKSTALRKDGTICWLELISLLATHLPNYSKF